MEMILQISQKLVPKSPIDNILALVQVMAWRRTDNKPLPEPMVTQFTDAYVYTALEGNEFTTVFHLDRHMFLLNLVTVLQPLQFNKATKTQ